MCVMYVYTYVLVLVCICRSYSYLYNLQKTELGLKRLCISCFTLHCLFHRSELLLRVF